MHACIYPIYTYTYIYVQGREVIVNLKKSFEIFISNKLNLEIVKTLSHKDMAFQIC